MATQSSGKLPIGAIVENTKPAPIPTKKTYAGEFVKLHPVDPENDVNLQSTNKKALKFIRYRYNFNIDHLKKQYVLTKIGIQALLNTIFAVKNFI